MKQLITLPFILIFLICCNNSNPKVVYQQSSDSLTNKLLVDTLAIEVAGLPVHFEGTSHLIHPIGKIKPNRSVRKAFMSSYSSHSSSRSISFFYKDNSSIRGDIINVRFQHIDSVKLINLTNKQLKINEIEFIGPKDIPDVEPVLLYQITDIDTNEDLKLNDDDIESLYISSTDGQHFKKLTPAYEELINWELMKVQKRIYFITSEDINKDGEFNKTDTFHYYYVDLNDKSKEVIEYNPLL